MFDAIIRLVTQGLKSFSQQTDPETKRLKSIADVDYELAKLQRKRDNLLKEIPEDEEKKTEAAIELGVIAERIVWLRNKRNTIKR